MKKVVLGLGLVLGLASCETNQLDISLCEGGECNGETTLDLTFNEDIFLDDNGYYNVPFNYKSIGLITEITPLDMEFESKVGRAVNVRYDTDYWIIDKEKQFNASMYDASGDFKDRSKEHQFELNNTSYSLEHISAFAKIDNIAGYKIDNGFCWGCGDLEENLGERAGGLYTSKKKLSYYPYMRGDTANVFVQYQWEYKKQLEKQNQNIKIIFI